LSGPVFAAAALLSILGLVAFVRHQARVPTPLVRMELLKNRAIGTGLLSMMLVSSIMMATLVMAFTLLTVMFSGIRDRGVATASNPSGSDTVMLATNRGPLQKQYPDSLSASDYAKTRLDISSESPSVNPQGALIALTKSLVRGGMKDDEVVVVADVFGNGLARISEVIEPSRDSRAIAELQKALESDPAYSPFVTANLDKRSDSVRVVLRFQSVDVRTGTRIRKQR